MPKLVIQIIQLWKCNKEKLKNTLKKNYGYTSIEKISNILEGR